MKNNPFVIFVTAFLVVMGSGLAIAAIGGPSTTSERIDESSFAVDFGGELDAGAQVTETTSADPLDRGVDAHVATGVEEKVAEEEKSEAEKQDVVLKDETTKDPAPEEEPKQETPKADEPKEVDESTWIEVLAPTNGQVFEDKSVVFEGKAEPGAKVYAVQYEADFAVRVARMMRVGDLVRALGEGRDEPRDE